MVARRARSLVFIVVASGAGAAIALGSACTSFSADTTTTPPGDAASAGDTSMPMRGDSGASDTRPIDPDAGLPCSDSTTVLLGITDLTGQNRMPDFLVAQDRDAHYFVAGRTGTARCAWLYLGKAVTDGSVYFGVYAGGNGGPTTLLARAKFTSPLSGGWNHAPLEGDGLSITAGDPMWIGFGPDKTDIEVNSLASPACDPLSFGGSVPAGVTLSDPFTGTMRFPNCSPAAYLGR